jgi:phospholipase/carboxylesterase
MSEPFVYALRPAATSDGGGGGRAAAAAPGALVLLHGKGTDERDLLPLLNELDPAARLTCLTLRAPLELTPGGYYWYIVRELGRPDEPTFKRTYADLSTWLDRELPRITGVGLDRTALGGFSQGAVMAHALALGRGRPSPAALIALSGFIPEVPGFALDPEGHRDVPVAIGHGSLDRVIPVEFGREAAERLRAGGMQVNYRETPMAHTIDPAFLGDLAHWLEGLSARRRAA